MIRWNIVFFTTMLFFSPIPIVMAHTPYMACFDNGDGTITCNGEFSDGSSAAGAAVRVVDKNDKKLLSGRMDDDGEYTFDKPAGVFTVIFDAGPGHIVMERSDTILE